VLRRGAVAATFQGSPWPEGDTDLSSRKVVRFCPDYGYAIGFFDYRFSSQDRMQELQELVDHYVAQLSGPKAFSARHSLIEAGPPALSLVEDAFHASIDPHVKLFLVQTVSEYRTSSAVPFLQNLLTDRRPEIWQTALDGLVILGNHAALDALRETRLTAAREQRSWIDDAIRQIADGV